MSYINQNEIAKFILLIFLTLDFIKTSNAYGTTTEEFNKLYPPSTEVQTALERVSETIPPQDKALEQFNARHSKMLLSRADACAKFNPPYDAKPEQLRELELKRNACITEQDDQLTDLAGLSALGYLLKQPALVPLSKLGIEHRMPESVGINVFSGAIASKSNVAVLQADMLMSVEVPSGKKIANIPKISNIDYYDTKLSPNGLITVTRGNGLVFYNTKTGKEIWKPKNISRFYSWLPEINAALVGKSRPNLLLLDFDSASIKSSNIPDINPSWAIHSSESTSRVLVGRNDSLSQVEIVRTPYKIEGRTVKDYKLAQSTTGSSHPILMQDGKSIFWSFHTREDNYFTLFNLRTGEEKVIRHGKFLSNEFTKMNENEVVVYSRDIQGDYCTPYALNITNSTITRIKTNNEWCWGILQNLRERTGMMGRDQGIWIGDEFAKIGETFNLESAVNQRQTELDLKNIESRAGYSNSDYNRSADSEIAEKRAIILGSVPTNTKVQAIGVYQAKHNGVDRLVNVLVKQSSTPLILVLSSYSRMRWELKNEAGSNLLAVIVLSYEGAKIKGDIPTKTIIWKGKYAYQQNSPQFSTLEHDVKLWTSKPISKFQGAYEGESFVVKN